MTKNTTKSVKLQVVCCTYNHEKYIKDALDGFVMQKTNFPFEVLVGDDCSADKTSEIVAEYAKKYPDIIKHIKRKKNMGAQPNSVDLLERIDADYVALCEGDDYWTDENKLQKQVDFLEKNKHLNGCFHNAEILKEPGVRAWNSDFWFRPNKNGKQFWPGSIGDFKLQKVFYLKDILPGIIPTASVVYRWDRTIKFPEWFKTAVAGDRPFHCFMIKSGAIGYIDETMSVYRVSPSGAWFNKNNKKNFATETKEWVDLIENLNEYFDGAYEKIFKSYKENTINNGFYNAIKQKDTETLIGLIQLYPDAFFESQYADGITFIENKIQKKFYRLFGITVWITKYHGNRTKHYLFGIIKIASTKEKHYEEN